ncbi:hypothetical protein pb186bvf_003346 [Paramecium bursaria]
MEEIGFTNQEVEALEREFHDILNELAGDSTLERFKIEYVRLYNAFKQSWEKERKLMKQLRDLNNDIAGNAGKVQSALKYSQDDSQTIQYLKAELDRVIEVLEAAKTREETTKSKSESLTAEIKHLQSLVDQSNQLANQTSKIQELQNLKEELAKDCETLNGNLVQFRSEISVGLDRIKVLDHEKLLLDQSVIQLRKSNQESQLKVVKDDERKKKIQDELEQIKKNYDSEKKNYEKQVGDRDILKNDLDKLMKDYSEKQQLKLINDKTYDAQRKRLEELKDNYEKMVMEKEQLERLRRQQDDEIVHLKKELISSRTKQNQIQKHNDKYNNEIKNLEKKNEEAIKEKQVAVNSINQLERHVIDTRKLNEEDTQLLEELRKAHDNFTKQLAKAEQQSTHLNDQIVQLDTNIAEVENKIIKRQEEVDIRDVDIRKLNKEKEKFGKQAAQTNAKFLHCQEEIKLKDNLISEFQKKNIETEAKLKQQQHLYEEVRSDRNLYSKNLLETEDEIAVIKKRHRIVSHQISQLKEEIDAKEVALAKEHFEHKKKDKTIEEQSRILEKNRKDIEEKEEILKNYSGEINKLHFVSKDSEIKRAKLQDEYEQVVSERDILGTHLIRKNDESALLYEKIKVQQQTLAKGESEYRERMSDIELLKFKISDLMRELRLYRKQAGRIPEIKQNIYELQNNLTEEKLKVIALSEELENPNNAHRCRKLQGSDPDVYEMKQKIKTLQRRLIFKTEQVVEKEVLIQQKEKQILELREIMRRQPGLEEAERISVLQEQMKAKTRQMKSLAAELNMYQAQINEFKFDIERLNKELQETKRKYLEQRKREQIQQEQAQMLEQQ